MRVLLSERPSRRHKWAAKLRKYRNILFCLLQLVVPSPFIEVLRGSHAIRSLPMKSRKWLACNAVDMFVDMPDMFMTSLKQTFGHKMAVFSRLSNVDFYHMERVSE